MTPVIIELVLISLLSTLHTSHVILVSLLLSLNVNVYLEPLLWISIYPRAERRHRSTVFIVNSEHNSHHFLAFYC